MNEQVVYTGWKKIIPTAEQWELINDSKPPIEMKENEYLLVYEGDNLLTVHCLENGKLRKVPRGSIPLTKKISADSKVIYPRNDEQICAIDMLKDRTKPVKLLLGTFGSGKTYLAINSAILALHRKEFKKIVWVRNNVRVADTPDLGILPGNITEKLLAWSLPVADVIGETELKSMIKNEMFAIEPLQTLRGRNFSDSIIICDECEGLTLSHIKLILGRIGEGSEVWFLGDLQQKDLPIFEKSKGVENMIECLKGNKLFAYTFLVKSERSEVARLADTLDRVIIG